MSIRFVSRKKKRAALVLPLALLALGTGCGPLSLAASTAVAGDDLTNEDGAEPVEADDLTLPEPQYADHDSLHDPVLETIDESWRGDEPLDVTTTDSDWTISQNETTGMPENRSLPAKVLVRDRESGQCEVRDISIVQKHQGGGTYSSKPEIHVSMGPPTKGPCPED